jgi:hypothetical protein
MRCLFPLFQKGLRTQIHRDGGLLPFCNGDYFLFACQIGIGAAVTHRRRVGPGNLHPGAAHRTGRKPLDLLALRPKLAIGTGKTENL